MDIIKQYWFVAFLAIWFIYKWQSSRKIKRQLPELKAKGAIVIDVRSQGEFLSGHAPESQNFPLSELSRHVEKIPKNTPIVVCCASGTRSGMAKLNLMKLGFREVYNIGAWTNLL